MKRYMRANILGTICIVFLVLPNVTHATLFRSIDITSRWYSPPQELAINALIDNTPEVGARLFSFSSIPLVGSKYILNSGDEFNATVAQITKNWFKFLSIGPNFNAFDCTNLVGVGDLSPLNGYEIDSFELIVKDYREISYGSDDPNFTCIGLTFNINCNTLPDPIPEPATFLLFGSGLLALFLMKRRQLT